MLKFEAKYFDKKDSINHNWLLIIKKQISIKQDDPILTDKVGLLTLKLKFNFIKNFKNMEPDLKQEPKSFPYHQQSI